MSYYEGSKHYREYALIQGINMLTNMVNQIRNDKATIQDIYEDWINSGMLRFRDQIDLIFGTAADNIKCRYMVYCINQLNSYMLSKYPKHRGLMRSLTNDILSSINMAVMGSAHIWNRVQLDTIRAAFMSTQVTKAIPYEKEKKKLKRKKEKEPNLLEDKQKVDYI